MTMLLDTNSVQGCVSVLSFLTFKSSLLVNALMTWIMIRKTHNTLLSLPDRQLTDIGLNRGEILRIARL
jgi:uncharacterized protein YjiS (DUF1127 family)